MGEAKRRGSFLERKEHAIKRNYINSATNSDGTINLEYLNKMGISPSSESEWGDLNKILIASNITKVYRYFDKEIHADNFCKGQIRLSTLQACREYEDIDQGDMDEGKEVCRIKHLNNSDPLWREHLKSRGIEIIGNVKSFTMENVTISSTLNNAHVLCTTNTPDHQKFAKSFGEYCVEIAHIESFYHILGKYLWGLGFIPIGRKKVTYGNIEFDQHGQPIDKIGFVKLPRYQWQDEYRLLWERRDAAIIEPKVYNCSDIAHLCKRIK